MAIDEKMIIDNVSKMEIFGNENGLIPAFGVYLTNVSTTFYNKLSYEFIRTIGNEYSEEAKKILINIAWVCGYNTFHGIQTSVQWKNLIEPMVSNPADKLLASIALSNALGWAKLKVIEIVPGKSCKIRAEEGYEAEYYLETYGKSKEPVCFTLSGVFSALMDLSYGSEYPTGIYTFETVETKCRAKGDNFCEFETKIRKN